MHFAVISYSQLCRAILPSDRAESTKSHEVIFGYPSPSRTAADSSLAASSLQSSRPAAKLALGLLMITWNPLRLLENLRLLSWDGVSCSLFYLSLALFSWCSMSLFVPWHRARDYIRAQMKRITVLPLSPFLHLKHSEQWPFNSGPWFIQCSQVLCIFTHNIV